jgi:hypothetical protein
MLWGRLPLNVPPLMLRARKGLDRGSTARVPVHVQPERPRQAPPHRTADRPSDRGHRGGPRNRACRRSPARRSRSRRGDRRSRRGSCQGDGWCHRRASRWPTARAVSRRHRHTFLRRLPAHRPDPAGADRRTDQQRRDHVGGPLRGGTGGSRPAPVRRQRPRRTARDETRDPGDAETRSRPRGEHRLRCQQGRPGRRGDLRGDEARHPRLQHSRPAPNCAAPACTCPW